ncbi:uncharacterized protein LOC110094808 isoform X1 [Dendrobium catenatum]|uniref:uncharacterized protein LOC110094808 isoform X1 n=1 Tax=Dendrobium catenatum TaxID=906689 RepID=UPI0009F21997|nr:uncharacterized protein LOC110094808 isoform X1 [Dendrobium catenatum]XP_020675793.1 uncharacterized protein LOC110094808 isoform X1 [Dendrobium catenatum]
MAHEEKERQCSCVIAGEYLCSPTHWKTQDNLSASGSKILESSNLLCRVCQCAESDIRGDAVLCLLDISLPSEAISKINKLDELAETFPKRAAAKDVNDGGKEAELIEFISPDGEVFVCSELESSSYDFQNTLVNLGCSCKNDLALAHYSCALKWFISHGSTICEICGTVAKNIRHTDFVKVVASLKEYESLREKTAMGELAHIHAGTNSGVDPDALAAVRRQRLNEVSFWFNPQNNAVAVPQEAIADQPSNVPTESIVAVENPTTTWAVEGTGILVATGLLTVTLAWLIAPHVGKKTARNGFHILLGGIIALTIVIFLRFVVLSRIKYGPARYWPILIVFWFIVFGIWASRTRGAHNA